MWSSEGEPNGSEGSQGVVSSTVPIDALVRKLCARLQQSKPPDAPAPREWRLVGQEQDSSLLLTWICKSPDNDLEDVTSIGTYMNESNEFQILYRFNKCVNIVQASVNDSRTLLVYVVKNTVQNEANCAYRPYLIQLRSKNVVEPVPIEDEKDKQVMVQFLYKKTRTFLRKSVVDKFLVLVHLEYIRSYTIKLEHDDDEDLLDDTWNIIDPNFHFDCIVKSFSWAQWDPIHQVLYYIHYRLPAQSTIEAIDNKTQSDLTPTLSGFQFHDDMPHETVLNIPLNLPHPPATSETPACGLYEDDAVPLRIHDCSLDLQIVSHPSGIVCVCHHYLYKSAEETHDDHNIHKTLENENIVHFAYSITLLHHGYVTHCVIPNVIWTLAKSLRPTFSLYKEEYLLVHLPNLFTHLLDIGLSHEPCCHIVLPPNLCAQGEHLVPLIGQGKTMLIDLVTLNIIKVNITNPQFITGFKSNTSIENRLSILHYFLHHDLNIDIVEELISEVCIKPNKEIGTFCAILKEFLLAGSFIATKNCLATAALPLMRLLPFTTNIKPSSIQINGTTLSVNQEELNTAMMLLSPRQRIVPFRSDMWTRLWDCLSCVTIRFKSHQVLEKLRVSLACYQPEALSRCSTPLSPAGAPPPPRRVAPPFTFQSAQSNDVSLPPFIEIDTCTASKQEHIISVNLREVSMHLLKHGSAAGAGQGTQGSASHVHAVATRYAAAQLETSRTLCLIICKALAATAKPDQERGFAFIDEMDEDHRYMLLKALETYYLAADSMAFPLPQGFPSFFTYLGYRSLSFAQFLQYIHRNVFEVQIDFLKVIISEAGDNTESVLRGIYLAALGGKGRGRRALVSCNHPSALLLRAREHAATILAGQPAHLTRPVSSSRITNTRRGLAAFPSGDRLSPLDTFLDLLTAKANLNELDFNLLIDATISAEI